VNTKTYTFGGLKGKLQNAKGLLSNILQVARVLPAAAAMFCAATFAANAETRTLKIYHVHLNERSTITYKRNGKFLPDGLNKLNKALRDWRRNEPTKMDPRLFDVVWEAYKRSGATGHINVIGGYRSAATNSMLRKRSKGVAEKSQHVLGRAMDFYIPGVSLKKLRNAGLQAQAGGVGYYPSSGSPFVHMDVGNIRYWPRMSRRELLAVFPGGKTVHLPSDGKPLPGYELALASAKSRKAGTPVYASGSDGKGKSLLAILFGGGGADEEEDIGGGEEVAIAAATPKPAAKRAVAEPVEPLPLPENPAQPAIVAALPRRDQDNGVEPPRPDEDLNAQAEPEVLAFAVPLPQKKPKFAALNAATKEAEAEQAEIAAAIASANATPAPTQIAVAADPEAEAAAIRSALGQDQAIAEPAVADEPFFAGVVPVPGAKPKAPELLLASVAIPAPRPVLAADAVEAPIAAESTDEIALAMAEAEVPVPSSPEASSQETGEIVASVGDVDPVAAEPDASLRTAMIDGGTEVVDTGVKTTGKASKPKSTDAKPAIKTVAKAPSPKVGKFALSRTPVKIANQPVAPEYAQALIRAAPSEVLVSGFSNEGPLQADKFSGKAVNFLRVARFDKSN
jgi:uncharacterized protein YcbK (DUF882 family)